MELFRDRRLILGGGAALVLGLGAALLFTARDPKSKAPPPASRAGLVIEEGQAATAPLDPGRPLRCFVAGQLVGEMSLADCARKNGVATRQLDVGVDASGPLAATGAGPAVQSLTPAQVPVAAAAPVAPCWRRDEDWRRLPTDLSLNACVQALFAGRCEKAGEAAYGRWGDQTLRLVPKRVEISADNRAFRALVEQEPDCALPAAPG